eukprot:257227_1
MAQKRLSTLLNHLQSHNQTMVNKTTHMENQLIPDKRNENIKIFIGDRLYDRNEAKISVFDSIVQGGDAVWEGLRVYNSKIFLLNEHLNRLFDSAKALMFKNIPSRTFIKNAIFKTLNANKQFDETHIRLTLTRGNKVTSGMSPTNNKYGCCLIVLAEFKSPMDCCGKTLKNNKLGINLITSSIRRNSPQSLDSKIHHANLLNNILAKIEANNSGADDALMLDYNGYVSETNATNVFIIKNNIISTPKPDYCLPGITRKFVIDLCKKLRYEMCERNISMTEVYCCDEMFTTGTMGELTPVFMVDGREIGNNVGIVTRHLQIEFRKMTETMGVQIPIIE